ncbi:type IV secretion system protein TraC [Rubrivivax gelatinosus]|uniref:type IV secretion system protein TraC n=1 Tax=Rubrivivax gelatinosus TaxID=28068 RepID=UPI000682FF66|nr:type IV secretion system protein TraC [Rubrivivax gelatinosus]MBG6083004.1 conjugal transfer ATP-binding protein TraC [Rubrivivax gelatinosus]
MHTLQGHRANVPFANLTVMAYDPPTQLFHTTDGKASYLAALYVGAPLGGASSSTVEKFKAALAMPLPPGSFVQLGLLSTGDVEELLDGYTAGKTNEGVLGTLIDRHYEHTLAGREQPLVKRSGIHLHRQRLVVSIKIPLHAPRPSEADIVSAKEYSDRFSEALKAAGLNLDQLDHAGYLALTRLLLRPWDPVDAAYDESSPLREQVYSPGDAVCYKDRHIIDFHNGQHYAKLLSVKRFPKRASMALMNYMIGEPHGLSNQITDPYWITLTLHYPDQVAKADWVRTRSAMINHQVFGPTAHMIPILGYKKQGIDVLVHEMEGKGAVLCEVNFSIFLMSRSKERLNKLSAGLRAYYSSLAFEMREDARILEVMWDNMLPLNVSAPAIDKTFRFHTMAVAHAVQFLPVIGEWRGTGVKGAVLMLTRRGQPALWDLYHSHTNYNAVIFAESGAGKSFLTQKIVVDYLAEGAKVWAIDVGHSYKKLAKAVSGEFIEFHTDSQICLNPFTHIEGNLDEEMDILKATIAKMAAPEETLSDYQMAILEQAITSVYTKFGNQANITAIAEFLLSQTDVEAHRLAKQLYPFAGGAYTRWFDGENNLDLDNAFVVLELQDLKGRKALQQVVLLQLISRINHEMYKTHGRKKVLIIDEAWEMLDDPMMAKAMEAAYRKARKHDGAVIVVTQSIGDLYNSPNSKAIAANSAWQLILQQKAEQVDSALETGQFKIEAYGAHMLKSVHTLRGSYSEVMIKRSENDWGIVRLVVDRFHQVMFSTTGDERDDLLDAIDRGDDVVSAIDGFIAREAANEPEHLAVA